METDYKSLFVKFCEYNHFSFSISPICVPSNDIEYNKINLFVLNDKKLNILSVSASSEDTAYQVALQHFMPDKSFEEINLILAAGGF